ncbi:dipeptide epimerase, partial [Oligoflexia bacterium]|nr:dipeptide epimerase [Oligoflexia bacterium]
MEINIDVYTVHKIVPLRFSRKVETSDQVAVFRVTHEGVTGLGEVAPFSYYGIDNSWPALEVWFSRLKFLETFSPLQRRRVDDELRELDAPAAIRAGIDIALHDWIGKVSGLPLFDILGLRGRPYPDTSLTIGINPPDAATARLDSWLKLGPTRLWKVKLGSPEGLAADKAMFEALAELIQKTSAKVYVDANGGWNQAQAFHMAEWLKPYGVLFVEQPLPRGEEVQLAELSETSALPIYADESCLHSHDMQELVTGAKAGCHGINIKLMKCGGIREAIRMITLARHHNLKIMLGCFSNTILGNTAAAHLSSLVDYVDLDSHLNLKNDPCSGGAIWHD